MNQSYDTVVIGSGLTGLTTAFYLKRKGLSVLVVDQNDQPGGVIRTHRQKGFIFECGPNTGVLSTPEVAELFEDLKNDCDLEIASEEAKTRWVWKGDKWHALPSGLAGGITTPLFTWKDKFRLLGEPFRKPGTNPDETLAALVKRRMGNSFLDYAVDPFILGIYAGDPGYLVPRFALPKLYNLEQTYGSFIGGAVKKKRAGKTEREKKATGDVFSVKGGLSNLIWALEKHIGNESFHFQAKDVKVHRSPEGYDVKIDEARYRVNQVVYTGGSHSLHQLFDFISAEQESKLDNLTYAKVVQVALGFKKWDGRPLNAFGGLVPFREQRDVLGVLIPSSFLSGRAPNDGALLSVFLGGVRRPEVIDKPDEEIRRLIKQEISEMMRLPHFNPEVQEIFRYQHAIPQYGANTYQRLETIEQVESRFPGLFLGGNMRDGIGMADRIRQGRKMAEQVLKSRGLHS
jgi:oxygen-dependent protoporphyrinogen oxidase